MHEQMRQQLFENKVNDVKTNILKNIDLDESIVSDFMPNHAELQNSKLMTDLSGFLKQTWKTSDDEKASTTKKAVNPDWCQGQNKDVIKRAKFFDHSALLMAPAANSIPKDLF